MTIALTYLARFLAVLFVFPPHEFAHAFVAYKNGDITAKANGRLTLNPIKHFDPVGFLMCALVGFGWAKPVPIDSRNFRNYKKGMFTTAIAGVVMNFIIAFFAYLFYVLILLASFNATYATGTALYYLFDFLSTFFYMVFSFSLCCVVFNLLPFYPLDGFRVVEALTRQINPVQKFLRNYGNVILIVLLVESFLCNMVVSAGLPIADNFNILGWVLRFATNIIGFPIKMCWNWILTI